MNIESTHFLNGKFVKEEDLLVSPRDLGYSRGYGVFEFLVTYGHRPFLFEKHIDRLFQSAERIMLRVPWSKDQILEWVYKTLDANKAIKGEKVIRIIVSGGPSLTLTAPSSPTIVITVDPNIPCPSEDYENGVSVLLNEFQRYRPEAKTNNYIEAVRALSDLHGQNIDEIIYHSDGMVHEGSRSNIFAIIDGKLMTPVDNVLGGVTRGLLLDILKLSIPISIENFSVEALYNAPEVFITATGKGVMPVTRIGGQLVGNGEVGPVTREIMKQHRAFISSGLW